MIREEAIDFGKMWLKINNDSPNSNSYELIEMAIQSLEQIKQIKYILKEWYLDSCLKGDDYMNEIREVLDK